MDIQALSEGLRILKRGLHKQIFKYYEGNSQEICKKIIKNCWNGTYFQTSAGHFCGFYIRDFAWICESLIKLHYHKEVLATVSYALAQYKKAGKITTTLTPKGEAIDIHDMGPDSLAMLLRSLKIAKARTLVRRYKEFLEQEAQRYYDYCFDPNLDLVRRKKYFSSIRDVYKRDSACYDNWMIAMIIEDLTYFRLKNPWKGYNPLKAIEKNFWTGSFYAEDLTTRSFSSDANIFPFFWGLIKDKKRLQKIVEYIESNKLDSPLPLKYATERDKTRELFVSKFVPNYEGTAVWAHLGMVYLHVLMQHFPKKARMHVKNYEKQIEKYRTFPEVYDEKGNLFSTAFYFSDEAMIWCALYLTLYT